MLPKRQTLYFIILILLSLQAGLSFFFLSNFSVPSFHNPIIAKPKSYVSIGAYSASLDFYEEAYAQADLDFHYTTKVEAGILPHHLLVKGKIANFFTGLQKQNIRTVVLVGPNHFEAGADNILSSTAKWQTPYGDLLPNDKLIKALIKSNDLQLDDKVFAGEHSISGLVPFIKKSLPQAKIVPIILKYNTSSQEIEDLAMSLAAQLGDDSLVLASVDFSHYMPALVADFHDDKSQAVIENIDFKQTKNLEVDSPASLALVLKYAALRQVEQANLLWQTNSSRLIKQLDTPGTSHQFFYFTKGTKKTNHIANFLFFGDIMLDRNVGAKIAKNGLPSLLDNLAGQEKRFFMGSDVVSANLEGPVTDGGQHYPPVASIDFAFSPVVVGELKKYNFNYFTIANNHLTDQGSQGAEETRKNLKTLAYNFSGCADAQVGECSGTVMDINGVKVAMLGFSMVYNKFDLGEAQKIISDYKNKSDLVIVNIHWGVEYVHEYNTTQSITAHALADSGADIIIGHHPHVVQGLEIYNNKPIFYSLGNFIFDQYFSADTQVGLSLGLSIDAKTKKGSIYLFPMQSRSSEPTLMSESEKIKFLQSFLQWSKVEKDKELELLSGKINF